MKIAIIGSKDFDSLEYHLHDTLDFMNYEVFHIDIKDVISISYKYNYWAQKLIRRYDEFIFDKISERIIDEKPDLLICTYRFINPACINKIKSELGNNIKIIHINPDQLTTFEYQQVFATDYDAYFTKDLFIVDFMKNKLKLNTYYLPEAINPRTYSLDNIDRSSLESKIDSDVTCFGTMYPYRAKMIEHLVKSGINVKLYGTPDKKFPNRNISHFYQNEFIAGKRKAEVLLGSKIIFNNFHYAEIESVNAKFFEIAGIGGFQICDYKSSVHEYSGIDVESFTFKHIDEAIEKINFYLDKPELRHSLAEQQRTHFLENHTYEKRINYILKCIY